MSGQVFRLNAGTTSIRLGDFAGKPAVFINPRYINEPMDSFNHRREAWDMNDLGEEEQVLLVDNHEQARELFKQLIKLNGTAEHKTTIIYPDPSMSYDNHG